MATSKKTQKKSTTESKSKAVQKIHQIMATDIFKSIAIASILANIFFVIMLMVGGNHSTIYINKGNYKQKAARLEDAQNAFCQKDTTDKYIEDAKNKGNEENAKVVVAANCGTGEYGEKIRDLKQNLIDRTE